MLANTITSKDIKWVYNWETYRDFCGGFYSRLTYDTESEIGKAVWGIYMMPDILKEAVENSGLSHTTTWETIKKVKDDMVYLLVERLMVKDLRDIFCNSERWDNLTDEELLKVYELFYHFCLPKNAEAVLTEALTEGKKYTVLREIMNPNNSEPARGMLRMLFSERHLPVTNGNWRKYA